MPRLDGRSVTLVITERTPGGTKVVRHEGMDPSLARGILDDLRARPDVEGRIEEPRGGVPRAR